MPHYSFPKTVRKNQHKLIDSIFSRVNIAKSYRLDNNFSGEDISADTAKKYYDEVKGKMKISNDGLHVLIQFHSNWWYELELKEE